MKRKYKKWLASLGCLAGLGLSACGGGIGNDGREDTLFAEDSTGGQPTEDGHNQDAGQCTQEDMSKCTIGASCIAGLCVGGDRVGGGAGECESSVDCPNIDDVCSNGVCM